MVAECTIGVIGGHIITIDIIITMATIRYMKNLRCTVAEILNLALVHVHIPLSYILELLGIGADTYVYYTYTLYYY